MCEENKTIWQETSYLFSHIHKEWIFCFIYSWVNKKGGSMKIHPLENAQKLELLVASVTKFLHTCQNIPCMHQCLYAWAPKYIQRPGWACTESCTQQLPVTASDRHGAALISWPVTTDTHSCAALGERAEGALNGGCKVRRKHRHRWTHWRFLSSPSGQRTPPHAYAHEVMPQLISPFLRCHYTGAFFSLSS